ncbi:hypothetical protein TNCV_2604661 [Trichonephila clavipes]|nr:hypothetical protein TNCV_2604661 [Trichonephila clavipes]
MTATQIIGIEYTHNKNNYGLTATPRYRPPSSSPVGAWRGRAEEEGRESESNPNRRWLWLRNPIHMHTRVQTM